MPKYMIDKLNGNSTGHDDKQDTRSAYVRSYLSDDEDTYSQDEYKSNHAASESHTFKFIDDRMESGLFGFMQNSSPLIDDTLARFQKAFSQDDDSSKLKKKIDNLKATINGLNQKIGQLNENASIMRTINESLTTENTKLSSKLAGIESSKQHFEAQSKSNKKEINELRYSNGSLRQENERLKSQINNLNNKIGETNLLVLKQSNQNSEYIKHTSNLKKEIDRLKNVKGDMKEVNKLKTAVNNLSMDNSRLSDENTLLQNKILESHKKAKEAEKKIEIMRVAFKEENDKARPDYENLLKQKQNEINQQRTNNNKYKTENSKLRSENSKLTNENSKLKTENSKLKEENSKSKKKLKKIKDYRFDLSKNYNSENKLFEHFLFSLSEILECPILLEPFQSPTLTPSGHTIEKSVANKLFSDGGVDPITGKGVFKEIKTNWLAVKASNLHKEVVQKYKELPEPTKYDHKYKNEQFIEVSNKIIKLYEEYKNSTDTGSSSKIKSLEEENINIHSYYINRITELIGMRVQLVLNVLVKMTSSSPDFYTMMLCLATINYIVKFFSIIKPTQNVTSTVQPEIDAIPDPKLTKEEDEIEFMKNYFYDDK